MANAAGGVVIENVNDNIYINRRPCVAHDVRDK